jgi:hypothetical protein
VLNGDDTVLATDGVLLRGIPHDRDWRALAGL